MAGAIVQDKHDKGVYYVDGQTWTVGTRYRLSRVLGCGSFSSVVAATDNETGELVALKRIPDVLNNGENAKRVLREVCILRRLSHPHIIGLKDVFLRPSSTGRYTYKGGKLVPTSLDLYLSLEYCDQGDLFHMRGQLSEAEVKVIMLQLLSAVQYLHRNGVWHRDIKSANILMTYTNGARHIKLADLGSARSVLLEQRLRSDSISGYLDPCCAHHHHLQQQQQQYHNHHAEQQQHAIGTGAPNCSAPRRPSAAALDTAAAVAAVHQVLVNSQATQTSSGGAASSDGSPQRQRCSDGGVAGQQQQQQGSMPRRGAPPAAPSDAAQLQQQQQQAGGRGSPGGANQQQQQRSGSRLAPSGPPVHHSDSFLLDAAHSSPSEIYARPVAGGGGGFKAPLTRMVCTPCYRAPEVVMSRGGYTASIDMWGCGCVFGELLQRVAWIGKATTPQLQVAPVFAIHGIPKTPVSGDRFDGPTNSITRTELAALFAVIGTPSWRCIESVTSQAWRRYLRKIPGRAPTLFRRFGSAGEVAVDLLARLLSFDPLRRCSSEEAIAHEYFEEVLAERSGGSSANLAALMALASTPGPQAAAAAAAAAVAAVAAAGGRGAAAATAAGYHTVVGDALDAEMQRQQQQLQHDEDMQDWSADGGSLGQRQGSGSSLNILKRPRDASLTLQGSASDALRAAALPPGAAGGPFAAAAGGGSAGGGSAGGGSGGGQAGEAMDEDACAPEQQQQAVAGDSASQLPPLPRARSSASGGGGVQAALRERGASIGDLTANVAAAVAAAASSGPSGQQQQHYYELDDPAAALAALEDDMATLMSGVGDADPDDAPGGPPPQAPQPLRELLEREVAEHSSHLEARRQDLARVMAADGDASDSPPLSPLLVPAARTALRAGGGGLVVGGVGSMIRAQWQHLQPDPGPRMDPAAIGFQRLPHHADAEQTSLDPQQHLRAGRHGEWSADTLRADPRNAAGNVWGVSLVPSGYTEESHPELAAIIRSQNKR